MSEPDEVKVTAADFNGSSFDGWPFDAIPEWLVDAEKAGKISINTIGSTDYARWDVRTDRGWLTAGPGDVIMRFENGSLGVRLTRA